MYNQLPKLILRHAQEDKYDRTMKNVLTNSHIVGPEIETDCGIIQEGVGVITIYKVELLI